MAREPAPQLAIGLMSGTSADGVDAALMRTNGVDVAEPLGFVFEPYDKALQQRILASLGQHIPQDTELAHDITLAHIKAVQTLLHKTHTTASEVDLIGFHGQTIFHAPHQGITIQIGDASLLAHVTGINVVAQFRVDDVAQGGQGAPLIPVYHHALALQANVSLPVAFLNIGGVANLTFVSSENPENLVAFDCGPGNALLDDFMRQHTSQTMDVGGELAAQGVADMAYIAHVLERPFFKQPPPKSLDRNAFHGLHLPSGISNTDGAATLAMLTAKCVEAGLKLLPHYPLRLYVCGGGRHNTAIIAALQKALPYPVEPIEVLGRNGDALEAEGFAFLAVRSKAGLPLSYPSTTGVAQPCVGGRFFPKGNLV